MKANHRLNKTILSYVAELQRTGCFSMNGEYQKPIEKKLISIHRQLDRMIVKKGDG